jgi:hypothetical protein
MAIVNSLAKTQVEAGMPPYLSAQLQRGQVLKKTIVYKAGTAATAASSTIMDIPLPPGVVIDLSSVAMSHNGVGVGTYTIELYIADKQGNLVNNCGDILALTATATIGEIVRASVAANAAPWILCDPAQWVVDNGIEVNGVAMTYELLKEKYQFVLCIKNSAAVAASKTLSIIMDLVIP